MIRRKGKFEQPRRTPEPELDLSWLEQAGVIPEDAPTMQIPVVQEPPHVEPDEAPTSRLPELGPDLLYSGVPEPTPPAQPPAPRPQPAQRRIGLILGLAAGGLVLALILGVLFWGIALKNGRTVYPNVHVAGIAVGGMTRQEALDAVSDAVAATNLTSTLRVELPDRTLSFSPEQTNISLDAGEAVDKAMAYGREGNPFSAVTAYFRCRSSDQWIDLQSVLGLDTDYIREAVEAVADEIETQSTETAARYDAAQKAVIVDVGYPDRSLDVDGLCEVIYNAIVTKDFSTITWDYAETPCAPVDLTVYAEQVGSPAEDARYDEESRTILESVPGYGFDLEEAQRQIAAAAPGSQLIIELGELEPEITTQRLEQELFGTTLFETSSVYVINANRTENLRLACEAIDGTILNPGDIFSFNEIVGERTAEKGYKAATVYSGGQSLEELGGGVCQVASTIYYATLHLNLEQVHREPHQFVVTYVPYGMDATVYWGHIDYQFKNTLSNPIRILANTDDGSVNITFQGVRETENTVKMEYVILETYPWQEVEEMDDTKEPGYREVEVTPYTGYKVVTYKIILDADGNELSRTQEAVSVYSKRDQKVIVGPEVQEPDPWEDWEDDDLTWPDFGDTGDSDGDDSGSPWDDTGDGDSPWD